MVDCATIFEPNWTLDLSSHSLYFSNSQTASCYQLYFIISYRSRFPTPRISRINNPPVDSYFKKKFYGLFGMIDLLETSYVTLIDKCSFMGRILKSPILRIESLFFIALVYKISTPASKANAQYIKMIKECVKQEALYFSKDFDFTYNIQTLFNGIPNNKLGNGDGRYFFNKAHLQLFIDNNISELINQVIYGFFRS